MNSKFIDITIPLKNNMDVYEGDPIFNQEFVLSLNNNDLANVSKLTLSSHSGTHVDAPLHFLNNSKSISELDLNILIGKCFVKNVLDNELINNQISINSLKNLLNYERILFKTSNSKNPGKFFKNFISLSIEAANLIINSNIKLIGIDSFSIEKFNGNGDLHKILLNKEIIIIETLNLSEIEEGEYDLICLPLKIENCDASPARVLLKKNLIF